MIPPPLPRVLSVVGARPNFMKLAPVARAMDERGFRHVVVHTGQHYDADMSGSFFNDLRIRTPEVNLDVGSGSHAQQTATIMQRFEPVLLDQGPDIVLVYGDVNSTVAAALVAAKLGVKVGHVEAGLRSFDWTMPEEINRVVTDRLSDLLFVPSADAIDNLTNEGVPPERIHRVGNVMIDTLVEALPHAEKTNVLKQHQLRPGEYTMVTLHRPANVDDPEKLQSLIAALIEITNWSTVVFPVHPRTRERLKALGSNGKTERIHFVPPMPYLEMLNAVKNARLVITDSGGLQEETSFLGVPCITVRPSTERPVTCSHGTNVLVAPSGHALLDATERMRDGRHPRGRPIEGWDGKAAGRIMNVLANVISDT